MQCPTHTEPVSPRGSALPGHDTSPGAIQVPVGTAYLHQATGSRTSEAESRDPNFHPEKEGEAARQKGSRD